MRLLLVCNALGEALGDNVRLPNPRRLKKEKRGRGGGGGCCFRYSTAASSNNFVESSCSNAEANLNEGFTTNIGFSDGEQPSDILDCIAAVPCLSVSTRISSHDTDFSLGNERRQHNADSRVVETHCASSSAIPEECKPVPCFRDSTATEASSNPGIRDNDTSLRAEAVERTVKRHSEVSQ